jgi:perosamine synthetase
MSLRRLPPAASPVSLADLGSALSGTLRPAATREAVESDLASSLGADFVALVSSGRAALVLILNALRALAPQRTGVVIPAYSCFSVPAAVVKANLRVKLCDMDPETLDFDYRHLAALAAEPDTLCVISTHLFGVGADVRRARAIAAPHGVFVVDDAAQAFGTMTPDGPAGMLGDVGLFSFGRGKSVTAVHGGAVVCSSPQIAAQVRAQLDELEEPGNAESLATLLQAIVLLVLVRPSWYWLPASLPFLRLGETIFSTAFPIARMPGAGAGLLRRWRARAAAANATRSKWAAFIADRVPGLTRRRVPCIRLPIICKSAEERDRLMVAGNLAGLGFSVMYPRSLNDVPELSAQLVPEAFPNAERLAQCLLTVPIHPFLSDRDSRQIVNLLQSAALMEARS